MHTASSKRTSTPDDKTNSEITDGSSVRDALTKSVTFCVALAFFLLSANAARAQEVYTFRSENFPDRFIRHTNFLGELTPLNNELDKEDAKFIVRPALSGTPGAVSFEAANYRGYFLRHQNFRLKLQQYDGTPSFLEDASFRPLPGLANRAAVSYESVNFKGHFIRHHEYHLQLNRDNGQDPQFQQDATFSKQGAPLAGCKLWSLSGPWEIVQQNRWNIHADLQQTGSEVRGDASYCTNCGQQFGDFAGREYGPVIGNTYWDKFKVVIHWPGSTRGGEYSSNVGSEGQIFGFTRNLDTAGELVGFHSDRGSARCIDAGGAITATTPASSAEPPSKPVKILGKRKLPPPQTPPVQPQQQTATATDDVDIYDGPDGDKFNVIGMMEAASSAPILGHEQGWYRLKLNVPGGSGWVAEDHLKIKP